VISRTENTGGKALKRKGCGEIVGRGAFLSFTEMGRSRRKMSDWQTFTVGSGASFGAAGGGQTGRHTMWGLGPPLELQEEDRLVDTQCGVWGLLWSCRRRTDW
jgi:hypothetical protein